MGWASAHIARLQDGETVQFRPRGNSMQGKIESGQLCTVEPVDTATLKVGDIVLCKVNGKQYLGGASFTSIWLLSFFARFWDFGQVSPFSLPFLSPHDTHAR
jgi:hypothetical protein